MFILWFSLTLYFFVHCAYQYNILTQEQTQTQSLQRIETLLMRERISPNDTIR
jgi:hypothetical protein